MKTISIRHGLGPLQTTDSPRFDAFDTADALGEIVSDLEGLGLLEPIDLARIRAILTKYTGNSGVTNTTGVTRAGDAADALDAAHAAGRQSAAKVRGQAEHIAKVANGYRDFWDRKNRELRDSVRR
jgi:hypothetical protein